MIETYANALGNEEQLAANGGKRIGILIVTYNAINTLSAVLKRITPEVRRNVEEIAIFDDASQDSTYELGLGLKTLHDGPRLEVLKHSRNLGYGGNQKAGYRYFLDKGFDIVVLLHGDGQYAPEVVSHLYHPLVAGEADAVFGSRMMDTYGGPLKGGMPLYKYVGNRILSYLENRALHLQLTEFHSGYRAYDLRALRAIEMAHMTDDFHFDTEIIIKLHHQGFRISEVPIPTYYGTEICHVNGMKYAWDVMKAVKRYNQTRRSVRRYPEFQEYFIHYPVKQSKYSSHAYAREAVGTGRSILDIGCGEAFLAAELAQAGNRVTGVDALPVATHAGALEDYFSTDLDTGIEPVVKALRSKRFDYVLLLDVLEHLRQPDTILRQCQEVVADGGKVLVSLPNVANITVRLMLLFGRFTYTERGILDRTHLHFYTRKSARALLKQNGLEMVWEKPTVMPVELALGLGPRNPVLRALQIVVGVATRLLPGLFGYQFVFCCRPGRLTANHNRI